MNNKQTMPSYLVELEHELADAHDRIRLLIAERDTARLQADQKINLREEFRELLGTDEIEQGVVVVRGLQDRIKLLEEDLMDAKNQYAVLVADIVLYEDRGDRIKRLEEAGDALCAAAAFMGWHMEIEKWNKAKEAKP